MELLVVATNLQTPEIACIDCAAASNLLLHDGQGRRLDNCEA